MGYIKNEIIRASKILHMNVLELTQVESLSIINQIVTKYANGKKGSFLWENFVEKILLAMIKMLGN